MGFLISNKIRDASASSLNIAELSSNLSHTPAPDRKPVWCGLRLLVDSSSLSPAEAVPINMIPQNLWNQ